MVRLLLISSWPLVSVMVWPVRLGAKTIVSLFLAAAISARSEPVPLSRLFVTVSVLGTSRPSSTSNRGRKSWVGLRAGARRVCGRQVIRALSQESSCMSHSLKEAVCDTMKTLRADHAPGPGRAGEGSAWRRDLNGRVCVEESSNRLDVRQCDAAP